MEDNFIRFQEVVIPLLRDRLGDRASVTSWIPDIDYRKYPVVNVRRVGGYRSRNKPKLMDIPVMELTVYSDEGVPEAEELYAECLDILFDVQKNQTVVNNHHISFIKETMGMTQFSSLFQDTYRVQGLIELGIRKSQRGTI